MLDVGHQNFAEIVNVIYISINKKTKFNFFRKYSIKLPIVEIKKE